MRLLYCLPRLYYRHIRRIWRKPAKYVEPPKHKVLLLGGPRNGETTEATINIGSIMGFLHTGNTIVKAKGGIEFRPMINHEIIQYAYVRSDYDSTVYIYQP